jgi:hypothetical protein
MLEDKPTRLGLDIAPSPLPQRTLLDCIHLDIPPPPRSNQLISKHLTQTTDSYPQKEEKLPLRMQRTIEEQQTRRGLGALGQSG